MARYGINYELGLVLCTKLLNARWLSQTSLIIIIIFGALICYQLATGEHSFAALLQPNHGSISLRPNGLLIYGNWVCGILHNLRWSFNYAFNSLIAFAILLALKLITPGDAFLTVVHRWLPSGLSSLMNHDLSDGLRTLTQDYRCFLV